MSKARITTDAGDEHEAIIADITTLVADPAGINRKVFAGHPVPGDLEAGYLAQVAKKKKPKAKSKPKKKAAGG